MEVGHLVFQKICRWPINVYSGTSRQPSVKLLARALFTEPERQARSVREVGLQYLLYDVGGTS